MVLSPGLYMCMGYEGDGTGAFGWPLGKVTGQHWPEGFVWRCALHPRGPPCAWARGRLEPQGASSAATQTTSLRPCWPHAPPPPHDGTHHSSGRTAYLSARPRESLRQRPPRRTPKPLVTSSYKSALLYHALQKKGSGDSRVRAYDMEEPVNTGPPPRASAKPPLDEVDARCPSLRSTWSPPRAAARRRAGAQSLPSSGLSENMACSVARAASRFRSWSRMAPKRSSRSACERACSIVWKLRLYGSASAASISSR